MFDLIKNALTRDFSKGASERIGWDSRGDAIQLAVCVLLLEVAHADKSAPHESAPHESATHESATRESATETDRVWVHEFIEKTAGLPTGTGEEILALAQQVRSQAIELWQFTHLIAGNFSVEEKLKLVEAIWRIIYLDGQLNMQEDYLIHKFSTLLGLRHSELIAVKLRVLEEQKGLFERRDVEGMES